MDGDDRGSATFSYSIRRKEKPVYERQSELCRFGLWVFPVSPQSSETCCGVFLSPRPDPYRLFSLNSLFALVPAGSRLGWCGMGNSESRPLDRVSRSARPLFLEKIDRDAVPDVPGSGGRAGVSRPP